MAEAAQRPGSPEARAGAPGRLGPSRAEAWPRTGRGRATMWAAQVNHSRGHRRLGPRRGVAGRGPLFVWVMNHGASTFEASPGLTAWAERRTRSLENSSLSRIWRPVTLRLASAGPDLEEAPLERPHRRLLHGLRVVPAADVQSAVRHQQPELVRGSPANVACLAASPLGRLGNGAFHGDHDVAEVDPCARRQHERVGAPGRRRRRPCVRRPCVRGAAGPGGGCAGAAPGCTGNADGGSSGNDRTSVGPSWPRWATLSDSISMSSVRITDSEDPAGAAPATSAAATTRAVSAPGMTRRTPGRTVTSMRQSPMRWTRVTDVRSAAPHRHRRVRTHPRRRRRGAPPAPRSCSPGTRSAGGTSRGAAGRTPP